MDVAELKRLLAAIARDEPQFLRDLFMAALRSDGRSAAELVDLLISHEEVRLKLAKALIGEVAIPLNVATKDDIQRLEKEIEKIREEMATKKDLEKLATKDDLAKFATKDDLTKFATREDLARFATKEDLERAVRRIEERMATKEQFEDLADSLEETARSWVPHLLKSRGVECKAERLVLPGAYEFDIYCKSERYTVMGEAKVRAGAVVVERAAQRAASLAAGWPDLVSGRVVPVVYTLAANPDAVEKARQLKVWLVEWSRELVAFEEAAA
ncbi:hypothetical protein [Pyrobaculum ferrireducens]|uniref:DUF8196 domain-containing protein n=1 Tax=Pyrobaculum ferrireducens TaxID=1104324 RepID=G7VAK1_9CREN|nr:hypothetical protein [Pyrobaculum ferrireducens]AET32240.1 hypothetical protein P186_0794 [Pyrobaculum ferrireducens]